MSSQSTARSQSANSTVRSDSTVPSDSTVRGDSTVRSPRGRRGTAATLTASIAVLVCAAGATEAIWAASHGRPLLVSAGSVAKFGHDTTLHSTAVLAAAIAVAVVGLVLLLAAIIPPGRRLVELAEPVPAVAAGLTGRSLTRTLAAAATSVDGVSYVRIKGGRRLTVVATTALCDPGALGDRVRDAVTARLSDLNPAETRSVRVRLHRKES